ncbi:hypothetical protein [Uliginosibacterium flavum]|uniref:DUF4410 domain-containing protein n=1 Tax=Uliginosibacterium flavum TaxID=1396831 RepID=A0ABV2TQM7_9RHOO
MRRLQILITFLLAMLPMPGSAAATHEISLSAGEVFQISETDQWRFELQKEVIGRFADVKISPKRGEAFSLTLYFIADTPDLARLDSAEKIARSVSEGSERYLATSVEKEIKLQTISARGSYGSLTVLIDAGPGTAPGGFKYLTRGMIRLSPDSALGFSLLSKEMNTAAYRQLLNYVYSFIRLQPGTTTAKVPAAAAPVSGIAPKSAPPAPAAVAGPRPPKPAARGADLRDCLSLPTDAEIMRCTRAPR